PRLQPLERSRVAPERRGFPSCERVRQLHDFAGELRLACALLKVNALGRGISPVNDKYRSRGASMLDNFRRRDVPQSTRLQSPYNRLQEALSAGGDEPEKAEGFAIE